MLLLVAALLAPLSALANWSRSTLLDESRYLAIVAPLAKDPAVQEEVSRRITNAVFEQLKVKELTTQTLDAIAARPRVAGVTETSRGFGDPLLEFTYNIIGPRAQKNIPDSQRYQPGCGDHAGLAHRSAQGPPDLPGTPDERCGAAE